MWLYTQEIVRINIAMFIYVSRKRNTKKLKEQQGLTYALLSTICSILQFPYFCHPLKITMSLIQQIRDRAAWIIFGAIAISLLAFIAQDYFFNKGRGSSGSGTTLAKINGESIDHDAFEHKVSFYEQLNNGQYQRSQLDSANLGIYG